MLKKEYNDVNSAEYVDSIEATGLGSHNLKKGRIKLRWRPTNSIVPDGDLNIVDGTLTASYHQVPQWSDDSTGAFGYVHFVTTYQGKRYSKPIYALVRSDHNNGFTIENVWDVIVEVFGGLPDDGSLCAFWLAGSESDVRVDLYPWRYESDEEPPPPPPPPPPGKGAKWPCFSDGRAPIVVMSPTGIMSKQVWTKWLNRYEKIVKRPRWDGTHTPLQGGWLDEIRQLVTMNSAHGKVSSFWLVPQEEDNVDDVISFAKEVLEKLRGVDGWKIIGPTYDVQERWSTEMVNEFVAGVKALGYPKVMVGARALPDRVYDGSFAAWEDHVNNIASMRQIILGEISRSGGRPCWNTERFRSRNSPDDDNKDWRESDIPAGIEVLRELNVGAVFGIQDTRGLVSDYGCGGPTSDESNDKISRALGNINPPPPEPVKAVFPLPNTWALMAVTDQQFKVDAIKANTGFSWIRSEINPSILASQGYTDPRSAAVQGAQWWHNFPVSQGFNVVVGAYGSPHDLEVFGAPHKWQEYVIRLGEEIANSGNSVWFTADTELDPQFIQGGIDQYIDLWWGQVKLVKLLQDMGHRIFGPGFTNGDIENTRRVLESIPLDAPSAHFYAGYTGWMDSMENMAKSIGYTWGVVGETGADGNPGSSWKCKWNGDEQQIKRLRQIRSDFDNHPFWTFKCLYQVLDADPNSKYPGYGLFKDEGQEWVKKPASAVFQKV